MAKERRRKRTEWEAEQRRVEATREPDTPVNPNPIIDRAADTEDPLRQIKDRCSDKWPSDFSMQEYCQKQQYEAVSEIAALNERFDGSKVWDTIFGRCITKWSDSYGADYGMAHYCAKNQLESARRLGKLR